jgi:hypothetical protein
MYYPKTTKFSRLVYFAKTKAEVEDNLAKEISSKLAARNNEAAKKRHDDSVNSATGGNTSSGTKSSTTQTAEGPKKRPDANSILQELKDMKEITRENPVDEMFTGEELSNFKTKLTDLKNNADKYHNLAEESKVKFREARDKYDNLSGAGKILSRLGSSIFGKGKLADARRAQATWTEAKRAAEVSDDAYNKTLRGIKDLTNETANKEELDGIQKEFEKNRNDISGFGRFMDWVSGGTVFKDRALNNAIRGREAALGNLRKKKGAALLALGKEADRAKLAARGYSTRKFPRNWLDSYRNWGEGGTPDHNDHISWFSRPHRRVVYNGTLLSRNFSHRTPQRYYPVPVYPHYYR